MTGSWQVYIILCSDNTFYTGITTDMDRRFRQHAEGRGARYFRGRRPIRVVYLETGHCHSSAARREVLIKSMTRADKALLVFDNLDPQHDRLCLSADRQEQLSLP